MNVKYDDYLYQGTKTIMELFASEGIDKGERDAIVAAFTDELTSHIGNTDTVRDYNLLINTASVQFVDRSISAILSNQHASYSDYQNALRQCNRQQKRLGTFNEKGWAIPKIENIDPQKCAAILRARQESDSISSRIINTDKQISILFGQAQEQLSTSLCDQVSELLVSLERDISACKQTRLALPAISNNDTKKLSKQVAAIRKNAELKEDLHQKIIAVDSKIHSVVSDPTSAPNQWRDVVAFCKQQEEQLLECKRRQWPVPSVRYSQLDMVAEKYRHYLNMQEMDSKLTNARYTLTTNKQYKVFFDNCDVQQDNINVCIKNGWSVPNLANPDPSSLASAARVTKTKHDKWKRTKRYIYLALIVVAIIVAGVIYGINKYRSGKVAIPFDAAYAIGQNQNDIYNALKEAGFNSITKKQDESGWLEGNTVLGLTIDNSENFSKDSYRKPDVSVVITYSSVDRIYVTDLLNGWEKKEYHEIEKVLEDAGFTNITFKEEKISVKQKENMISSIMLDGKMFTNERCFLSKKAPIVLSYYILQIGIGYDNSQFIGQNYENVVDSLEESGFTNVQTQEVVTGWAKESTVIGVTVNNTDSYKSDDSYSPDVKIVVKFSSRNRVDLTDVLKNWQTSEYETIVRAIKAKGCNVVQLKERVTDLKPQNLKVATITIDDKEFTAGECFVHKSATICVEYYLLEIKIGQGSEDIVDKDQYSELVNRLKSLGFVNIKLLRSNDLTTGWVKTEGTIQEISINSRSEFSASDSFRYDSEIVLVVHTFKNKGCEDIVEIAK